MYVSTLGTVVYMPSTHLFRQHIRQRHYSDGYWGVGQYELLVKCLEKTFKKTIIV